MQNHMRNMMQFRKDCAMKGCNVMAFLCPSAVKNTEKDRKLKDFHFSSICEEGESPCTL